MADTNRSLFPFGCLVHLTDEPSRAHAFVDVGLTDTSGKEAEEKLKRKVFRN